MSLARTRACVLCLAALVSFTAACSQPALQGASAPASLDELAHQSLATLDGSLKVPGLKQPVEIIRDQQGIPHIFAQNDDDLFFAQGYVMAQDRLWQLEMWRRWREGRLAEIFGPKAFDNDARARLMMFRGPWDAKEWNSYHPDAERLFTAWANGHNAYVATHGQPGGRIQADRHQAGAVDGENGDAALGGTWHRQHERTSGRRDSACAEREEVRGPGGQPAHGPRSV